MICTRCGSNIPGDTTALGGLTTCPRCGIRLAAADLAGPARPAWPPEQATGSSPHARSAAQHPVSPAFRLDADRWTNGDRITGIGTLLLFVSLFLPWYGVDVLGINAEADGLTGHGYLYIVLILCLAITAYLVILAGSEELPARLPLSHRQRLLAASGLNAVMVLLAFAFRPTGTGWRFGAFAGVIAALVAVAPLVRPAAQGRRARA